MALILDTAQELGRREYIHKRALANFVMTSKKKEKKAERTVLRDRLRIYGMDGNAKTSLSIEHVHP